MTAALVLGLAGAGIGLFRTADVPSETEAVARVGVLWPGHRITEVRREWNGIVVTFADPVIAADEGPDAVAAKLSADGWEVERTGDVMRAADGRYDLTLRPAGAGYELETAPAVPMLVPVLGVAGALIGALIGRLGTRRRG